MYLDDLKNINKALLVNGLPSPVYSRRVFLDGFCERNDLICAEQKEVYPIYVKYCMEKELPICSKVSLTRAICSFFDLSLINARLKDKNGKAYVGKVYVESGTENVD